MNSRQICLLEILKKHHQTSVKSLTVEVIKQVLVIFDIDVSEKKKKAVWVKSLVDFVGEDNFSTASASNDAGMLKEEVITFLANQEDEEDEGDDDESEGDQGRSNAESGRKRKRLSDLEEEVKRLKGENDIFRTKLMSLQLKGGDKDDVIQELAVDAHVRKYTDTIFTQLPSTNPTLIAEYDNLRKNSANAMKIAQMLPDHEGAKKLVSNLEDRALQIQVQALNPKLAQKMAFIDSNPLWIQNIDKLKLAEKLMKFEFERPEKPEKPTYNKNYVAAKVFDKEKKDNWKDKAMEEKSNSFPKRVKKCFVCGDPNHIARDCSKKNKDSSSDYSSEQFFRRSRRKKRGNSFYFEQMESMAGKRCSCGCGKIVEGRCSSRSRRRFYSIPRKGKFIILARKGKRVASKRGRNLKENRCLGTMSKSQSHCQISSSSEKRFVSINYRPKAPKSILSNTKIQIQYPKEVFRARTKGEYRQCVGFYVRYEIWISPVEGKGGRQILFLHPSWRRDFAIYSSTVWLEWITIFLYQNHQFFNGISEVRNFNTFELFRRYRFITFWLLFNCFAQQCIRNNDMYRVGCCDREEEKSADTQESISVVGYYHRSGKQETNHARSDVRKDSNAHFNNFVEISPKAKGDLERVVSVDWCGNCIYGLLSTSQSNVESSIFIRSSANRYWRLGFRIYDRRSRCYFQPTMDFIQSRTLEWKGIPISKFNRIFLDRCIKKRLGSILPRKEFKVARNLGEFQPRTHQYIGSESSLSSPCAMAVVIKGKELNNLSGFEGSSSLHKQWKSEISNYESINPADMADIVREQYSTAIVRMVTFETESNSRQFEQKPCRAGPNRLGNNSRSFSLSREASECIDRLRSIRLPLQLQSQAIHSEEKSNKGRESRLILSSVGGASSKLVLRTIQPDRKSGPTLPRVQSYNGTGSSNLEKKMVVEIDRRIRSSSYLSEWKRFQSIPKREPRTMQKIMGYKSNVNRLQGEELSKIADTLMSCSIEESTTKNYDSYWNRFIKFVMREEESPPATSEMVVRFLTFLFIKTPSGNNCRQAMYAIKHFCKMIGWEDPTISVRVHTVIRGMCNLSSVATKRERDPWRLDFIRKWIQVGRQFVDEKAYVLYTCLMIFGIRSMFRGGELGGLLIEDVKMVQFPVVGFSLTARKVKNDKKGRKSCIEATGSVLCPMKWLQRLLDTRDKGSFLFAGEFALNTVEISYILSRVASWIEADPGKYSSHSLRIGGATEASIMGIPETTIKAMGGWNSDAIDRYFRANFKGDRNGSRLMGF